MKKVVFVLLILVLVLLVQKEPVRGLEKGILMYLPFEESTRNAVNNQDGIAKNVRFVEGKVGQGTYFDIGSYLRFPAQGNINYREGTVEFWVKPNWDGDDDGYHYFFAGNITDARNVNSIHLSKKRYKGGIILGQIDSQADEKGIAISEAAVGGSYKTSVAHWKRDEWRHLALTWDYEKRTLKLYIDGLLYATENKVPYTTFPSGYEKYVNIGSSIDLYSFAESVIDELKIWNYALSDMEIAKIAGLSELGNSSLSKKESENPKREMFAFLIVLAGVFSLGGLLLFWKRNAFSIIRKKHEAYRL